jgi:primosomal protein N' (replication factor Y) (superfamily II helicase)
MTDPAAPDAGGGAAFVDVALPLPMDTPYTYAVPVSLRDRAAPGMRVLVPVQRRVETGFIVALRDTCDREGVRPLIDLPDPEPVLTAEMLDLCKWVSEYYCCSWGEALSTAVPAGIQLRSKRKFRLALEALGPGRYTDRQRKVIAELHRQGPLTERQLAKVTGATALSNTLMALVRRGVLVEEEVVLAQGVSVRTQTWVRLVEEAVPAPEELAALQRRAPKQAAVYLDLLHGEPERPAALLYDKHQATLAVLRALADKGLVALDEREFYRLPDTGGDGGGTSDKLELNPGQRAARDEIVAALDARAFQTFLLHGITGSGKTEVYLQVIEHALGLGRDAILLVPEISLTPQTVGRFKARFDSAIAVLHSGLGAGERYDEWRRARRGEVRIVVGARSAIFAPLPDVGIIIVDEEHDTSYKQGDTPRYHARDVAIVRANKNRAVCVAGSATPSVESYHNSERGKSVRLVLDRRATSGVLPGVEIIDMRKVTREHKGAVTLAPRLEEAVKERVARGDQVLLLLNRRGYAPFVLCPMCGWVANCEDCNVSMTYHERGAVLCCHYCNARRAVPQVCDGCGFNPLLFLGTGTQRIEEELLRTFPNQRVERMDADTTAGKGGHAKILGRLAAREIDILVGTQMIAKGHDYPGVTLVGVINGDSGLALPDFRAGESVFQLLTQVAGRAGRGDRAGHVLIQTYRPGHYAIQCAAAHDYAAFYAREIADREAAGYPPFRRLANLSVECEDRDGADRAAAQLHRTVREQRDALGFKGITLLGPAPATIHRIKKKYRWNIGLLSRSPKRLNELSRAVRNAFESSSRPPGVVLKIDLDPYGVY